MSSWLIVSGKTTALTMGPIFHLIISFDWLSNAFMHRQMSERSESKNPTLRQAIIVRTIILVTYLPMSMDQ